MVADKGPVVLALSYLTTRHLKLLYDTKHTLRWTDNVGYVEEKDPKLKDKMSTSSLRSFEYLEGLPGTTFNRLYKQPSTALAIFRRMLPHLGMLVYITSH